VLEVDRVLDSSPEELDRHRVALRAARNNRLGLIARSTQGLLARMDAAAGTANAKVLLHPMSARTVVQASNRVAGDVVEFQGRLGIEGDLRSLEARRWRDAATDARDKMVETGADGIGTAVRIASETFDRTKSATSKFAGGIAQRRPRRRAED
jgi:hypothetical protein